jgi:uncharacterized protein with FMN-binding domain
MWFASTVTIVVLLFGYHTSTNESAATVAGASSSASPSAGSAPTSSSPSGGSSSSGSGSSSESSSRKTYTGSVVQTRWGPVQVEITVQDGKISNVAVLQQPNGNPKDAEINAYSLPILIQDTLEAQSADIDMVSGATVTSEGYVQSLQAALDGAGI